MKGCNIPNAYVGAGWHNAVFMKPFTPTQLLLGRSIQYLLQHTGLLSQEQFSSTCVQPYKSVSHSYRTTGDLLTHQSGFHPVLKTHLRTRRTISVVKLSPLPQPCRLGRLVRKRPRFAKVCLFEAQRFISRV